MRFSIRRDRAVTPIGPNAIRVCIAIFLLASGMAGATLADGTLEAAEGGTVTTLAIDPINPSTVFAGTLGEGVFKTTDGGASWSAYRRGLPAGTSVPSLAIDPLDPDVVYLGTHDHGLFKSTDGGTTWSASSDKTDAGTIWHLAIDPFDRSILLAGGGDSSLLRSTDDGATWAPSHRGLPPDSDTLTLALDPWSPTVLAGASDGLFRRPGKAADWIRVDKGLEAASILALAIDPFDPAIVYAGALGQGMFKSVDDGASWQRASNGLPASSDVFALALDPYLPSTIYAGTDRGAFKSMDGGGSWANAWSDEDLTSVLSLVIDPHDPATVYAGTVLAGVLKSTDGGVTWNRINRGLKALPAELLKPREAAPDAEAKHRAREPRLPSAKVLAPAIPDPVEFERGPDAAWWWFSDANADQIAAKLDEGYRLVDLEVLDAAPLRFAAVLVRNSGPYGKRWWWYFGQTGYEVLQRAKSLGARPIRIQPYGAGSGRRFAVLYVADSGRDDLAWQWLAATTADEIRRQTSELGKRVIDIEAYEQNGQRLYSAIVDNAPTSGGNTLLVHSSLDGIEAWMAGNAKAKMVDLERLPWGGYAAIVASNTNRAYHWRYYGVTPDQIRHLTGRHFARVIDIDSFVSNGERRYDILMTGNGLPQSGLDDRFGGKHAYDSRLRHFVKTSGVPGLGMALVKQGRLIYTQAYGLARVDPVEPATPETLFRIGSTSKITAAIAMLQLIERGVTTPAGTPLTMSTRIFRDVLNGNSGVGEALTDYNPDLDQTTVRHVLQHLAGYPNAYNPIVDTENVARDLGIERTPSCRETVRWMLDKPTSWDPGTDYDYFNTGPCIISAAVEVLTGSTFEEYIRGHLFQPYNVQDSVLPSADLIADRAPREAEHYSLVPSILSGSEFVRPRLLELAPDWSGGLPQWDGLTVKFPYGGIPLINGTAPGGLAASPIGYARFLTGVDGSHPRPLISRESFTARLTQTSVHNPWYGSFVIVNPHNGDVFHNGAVGGGFGWYVMKTSDDVIWTVFANSSAPPGALDELNGLMIAAYNASRSAIDSATWDLFPTYGIPAGGPWAEVKKDVATTTRGNRVALSCHNCYNGPGNDVYGLDQANEKINRALGNRADQIELDVNLDQGTICVTHDAEAKPCRSRGNPPVTPPALVDVLENPTLRASDAMQFIEIKADEAYSTAGTFAAHLLAILDDYPEYAASSRPIFIRSFLDKKPFLVAIRDELKKPAYQAIRDHVRFSVLYRWHHLASGSSIADLQKSIETHVLDEGFHFVELDYQRKNLLSAVKYAQSLGLGAGIYTIPGGLGEVAIAAMREEVDQITAEYRIDKAREIVEEKNLLAYSNAWNCASASDPFVTVHRADSGGSSTEFARTNVPPTSSSHGSPALHQDAHGEDRFGCSLDFRRRQGLRQRALSLDRGQNERGEGFLVSALVNFDRLGDLPEGTMAIVNKAESGGFALELHESQGTVKLRFGVHVDGRYRYHSYDVHATGLGGENAAINGTDSYLLTGAYDGDGGVYLFVDNDRDSERIYASGGVTANDVDILVGADPQPSAARKARFFFDGLIQQVSVLRWGDHSFSGSPVN